MFFVFKDSGWQSVSAAVNPAENAADNGYVCAVFVWTRKRRYFFAATNYSEVNSNNA